MVFRFGSSGRRQGLAEAAPPGAADGEPVAADAVRTRNPAGMSTASYRTLGIDRMVGGTADEPISAALDEIDRIFVQVFALVGEAIAGATHALLAGDREAAKLLMQRDEVVDMLIGEISQRAQRRLVTGDTTVEERRELVAVLRMLPDLDRNGDLAEHIARRAARGLGNEMSARSRGLVERMGEVTATIWASTADAFAERSAAGASFVNDLDDELDELHVTLTAELVSGSMPLPVAIELAMVARFYERFGDHAVNLARRMAALASGGFESERSGAD
jgi:phosphate transport system protein